MAKIKLLDLDVNLDDSFQLVELSQWEKEAISGGGGLFAIGGVTGAGAARVTGASLPRSGAAGVITGLGTVAAAAFLASNPIGWATASLSTPA